MAFDNPGVFSSWRDAFLLGGARTPFTDLNGALSGVSPIDLGIKAARAALQKTGAAPGEHGKGDAHQDQCPATEHGGR